MPERIDLKGQVGNDEVIELTVTDLAGNAVNLDDVDLFFYVKRYRSDLDEDAVVAYTQADPEMVFVSAPAGTLEVKVSLPPPYWEYWWRLDVVQAGRRITALYGLLNMEAV